MKRTKQYWLMKSEPDVYSIQHLKKEGTAYWDGVRNYQARNFMRDSMKVDDLVLFYHSNADPSGVAGIAKICREGYPEPSDPVWQRVDITFVKEFKRVISLDELKSTPQLKNMMVVRRGMRLSIQPVLKSEFMWIVKMAGEKL